MTDNDSTDAKQALYCEEYNRASAESTILLIHGAFTSGLGWDLVTPHLLNSYHILLPDLPGHGNSKDVLPFSKELAARLLADLIGEKALDGRAHVIGMSLGAHVAIELALRSPESVKAVFVSGYEVYPPSQYMGRALWLSNRIDSMAP